MGNPLAAVFAGLSRLRGARVFHPDGVGFRATLIPLDSRYAHLELLSAGPMPASVRLSRALGLPAAVPDPRGIAVRVPDAYGRGRHQDLLLVTSGASPIARHLPVPVRNPGARGYSSLLPFRVAGELILIGAELDAGAGGPDGESPAFTITAATLGGSWEPVATLALDQRLPGDETERLRFNPANSGGGLEPAGLVNRLRPAAYAGSQAGWSAGDAA